MELLAKDDTVTILQRNLRILAIEMYKISNDLSPPFMKDLMTEIHAFCTIQDQLLRSKKTIKEAIVVSKNLTTSSQLLKRFPMDSNLLDI